MQSIKPIAYEILRRNDGMVAISVNSGLIDFEPGSVRIRKGSVFVQEKLNPKNVGVTDQRAIELVDVGVDVLERMGAERCLRLFEFASFGMTGQHTLGLIT